MKAPKRQERGTLSTDDVLNALSWTLERLTTPVVRQLAGPQESAADRRRLANQLEYARRRGLLAREGRAAEVVYRLTAAGRLKALGGCDPEERWARAWDGRWRLILFDLPASGRRPRVRLWRWLHANHFGCLQNSVWIHPDPLAELGETLGEYRNDAGTLTVMEAQCVAGYANTALVQEAWDFAEINRRYAAYLEGFGRARAFALGTARCTPPWARGWLRAERVAWDHARSLDPLLPRALLPDGYRGVEAWQARRRVIRTLLTVLQRG
jgi:phenylacetic acid degradation operon negative regulatory protein